MIIFIELYHTWSPNTNIQEYFKHPKCQELWDSLLYIHMWIPIWLLVPHGSLFASPLPPPFFPHLLHQPWHRRRRTYHRPYKSRWCPLQSPVKDLHCSENVVLIRRLCKRIFGGLSPCFLKWNEGFLVLGTQFAGRVFLGTDTMHFLSNANESFGDLMTVEYPFVLCWLDVGTSWIWSLILLFAIFFGKQQSGDMEAQGKQFYTSSFPFFFFSFFFSWLRKNREKKFVSWKLVKNVSIVMFDFPELRLYFVLFLGKMWKDWMFSLLSPSLSFFLPSWFFSSSDKKNQGEKVLNLQNFSRFCSLGYVCYSDELGKVFQKQEYVDFVHPDFVF